MNEYCAGCEWWNQTFRRPINVLWKLSSSFKNFFFVRVVFKNVFSCMESFFLENPTSCDSNMYSLELVIGSVIGSFVLALILGLVLGLLFWVKYARTYNVKQVNASMAKMDLSKGPLYEEVNTDKNVELTQNISYETVKNIK